MVIANSALPVLVRIQKYSCQGGESSLRSPVIEDALESMEEMEIHHTLFPEEALLRTLVTPDFPYIHKELLKSGVTL